MKKYIVAVVSIVCASNVMAQNDVSIMDLKETTYYLMKDVKDMKIKQSEVLKDVTKRSNRNNTVVEDMKADINILQKRVKENANREIIKGHSVPSELVNYLDN